MQLPTHYSPKGTQPTAKIPLVRYAVADLKGHFMHGPFKDLMEALKIFGDKGSCVQALFSSQINPITIYKWHSKNQEWMCTILKKWWRFHSESDCIFIDDPNDPGDGLVENVYPVRSLDQEEVNRIFKSIYKIDLELDQEIERPVIQYKQLDEETPF